MSDLSVNSFRFFRRTLAYSMASVFCYQGSPPNPSRPATPSHSKTRSNLESEFHSNASDNSLNSSSWNDIFAWKEARPSKQLERSTDNRKPSFSSPSNSLSQAQREARKLAIKLCRAARSPSPPPSTHHIQSLGMMIKRGGCRLIADTLNYEREKSATELCAILLTLLFRCYEWVP